MLETTDVSKECTFSPPVDLPAALDRLSVQFLSVGDARAIVIFSGAILNVESRDGPLTRVTDAEITVYDLPRDVGIDEDETTVALNLVERFVVQLTTAM